MARVIPLIVINLEADVERRELIKAQLTQMNDVSPFLLKALAGGSLCDAAYLALTEDNGRLVGKGALGCFLSHVSAWEHIIKSGVPWAVIIEDDVQLASDFSVVATLADQPSADLIFICDRMSLAGHADEPIAVRPILSLLSRLDDTRSTGSDGYILTSKGAEVLIAACAKDGFFGHIDGRLLRYVTDPKDLEPLPEDSWISPIVRTHHSYSKVPGFGLLAGGCLSRPVVRHNAYDSSRERENFSPGHLELHAI